MTAIEALIATGMFAIMIAMCFGILHWTSLSFSQQIREATLADKGEKTLKTITEDLQDGTQINTYNVVDSGSTYYSAEVRFKVPLKFMSTLNNKMGYACVIKQVQTQYDATGVALNAPTFPGEDIDFSLVYGWRDNTLMTPNPEDLNTSQVNFNGRNALGYKLVPLQGPGLLINSTNSGLLPAGISPAGGRTPDGVISFHFVRNPQVVVGKFGHDGLFSESAEQMDIDGDGQMTSTYAMGYIERSIMIGAVGTEVTVNATRTAIGDSCILQPRRQTSALPTDTTTLATNRIFKSDPNNKTRLDMCIWILSMDPQGQLHLMRCTTTDFLRNNAAYVTSTSATGTN